MLIRSDVSAVRCRAPLANSPTILALDLGSQTGWAVQTTGSPIQSGTVSFRPGRFEGGGMAFLRFKRWLKDMQKTLGSIDLVCFEEVRAHRGTIAAHVYGGFLGQLEAWCEYHEIPYQGVPVGTIKRHVTGQGNAGKAAVMAAVRSRGYSPTDDNEADAIAVLLWAIEAEGEKR